MELCCNDDGKNDSLSRCLVVSAVFPQRTFDADFPQKGQNLYEQLINMATSGCQFSRPSLMEGSINESYSE